MKSDISQDKNKRIAKNTLVLYFRMLFFMAVTLYTSRIVTNVLGFKDYGIYTALGEFAPILGVIVSRILMDLVVYGRFFLKIENYGIFC